MVPACPDFLSGRLCVDDREFRDHADYSCASWEGSDCTNWDGWTSYTSSELADVRRNCPVACEECESTCPSTCQAAVGGVYNTCDCKPDWSTLKPEWKANVEAIGCGGVRTVAAYYVNVLPLLAQAAIHTLAI